MMEPRVKNAEITKSGTDMASPVLLRRRLSAPETVMRKYKLARARSQENEQDQTNYLKYGELCHESYGGSDFSLQKKKDSSVMMRKSTLLRRLMNNPKTFGSSSFHEWQHYCGKLSTSSLTSLQGSPEHISKSYSRRSLVGYEFKTSPKHNHGSTKVSPIRQLTEPSKNITSQICHTSPKGRKEAPTQNFSCQQTFYNQNTMNKMNPFASQKKLTTSKNIFGDHSDSAYSNDRSKFSPTSTTSSSTNTNLTAQASMCFKDENTTKNFDQKIVDENRNFSINTSFKYVTQESATQTTPATNLNVISNVKLSQKTLDLIVSEVMRDVQKSCTNGNEIQQRTGDSIHVQRISGFNTTNGIITKPFQESTEKLSNEGKQIDLGTASSSFSGLSSKCSYFGSNYLDDNYDLISLPDSLEDTSSSRTSLKKHDDKPVRGDLPKLLKETPRKTYKPPDTFFIPMETNAENRTKSISDCLPEKFKERISKRQHGLQKRLSESRNSSTANTPFKTNKNKFLSKSSISVIPNVKKLGKLNYRKPILPSIEKTKRKMETNKEKPVKSEKVSQHKSRQKRKLKGNAPSGNSTLLSHSDNSNDDQIHIYKTENQYSYNGGPRRIYHKAEFRNSSKRIEILEIMECVDIPSSHNKNRNKQKSQIPVSVNQKSVFPEIAPRRPKYLDSEDIASDAKLDQLIANILITTLNGRRNSSKHTQYSEELIIHEENSEEKKNLKPIPQIISQVLSNDTSDNNMRLNNINNIKKTETRIEEKESKKDFCANANKGRAAVGEIGRDEFPQNPAGWVAFCIPQKSEESFDNSSNEGRKHDIQNVDSRDRRRLQESEEGRFSSDDIKDRKKNLSKNIHDRYHQTNEFINKEYSHSKRFVVPPPPLTSRYGQSGARPKQKLSNNGHPSPGEWSIILSGSNGTTTFTPDLEMKIHFPPQQVNYFSPQNDVQSNQISEDRLRFPRIEDKYFRSRTTRDEFHSSNICRTRILPEIGDTGYMNNQQIVPEPVAPLKSMDLTDIRPRQTKTSLRRYNLNRPRIHPLFESTNLDDFSQYPEILQRFPQLLSVSGNSLSPERKPNAPGYNRRNIPKHNCIFR